MESLTTNCTLNEFRGIPFNQITKGDSLNDKKMTGMETFWYYLQCLAVGAGYFAKIPMKKAMHERGLVASMTPAESIWYVLLCLCFGLGYFQKVIVKKALSEASL